MLRPDRYFDPDPTVRRIARDLYEQVESLPLVCPHGHVDPGILARNAPFTNPAELIIIPDHYIFRMLRSQGVPLEDLGVPRRDGGRIESDPRNIWRRFAECYYLFRGTPTQCWLQHELQDLFGIEEDLDRDNADRTYDRIDEVLRTPEFLPRALFDRFHIEVLCTTDAATDTLEHHATIRASGWNGRVLPTFRPDAVVDFRRPEWLEDIHRLGEMTKAEITSFSSYIKALESRREFFVLMGGTATDHAALTPYTAGLSSREAEEIFGRALRGGAGEEDAHRFSAHMLMEFARMSVEDGLVMQLHPGSWRNHDRRLFEEFGPDKGSDIPIATEYTRNLLPLLNKYGTDTRLRLVLFTLDESTYSRELAPLAGYYPALRLGPPWWFHDSIEGMTRFRERVTETAGFYNTAGFNDDTRAFLSIPARHDLCRRVDANYLARLVARHVIGPEQARELIADLSYNLVRETYRLNRSAGSASQK